MSGVDATTGKILDGFPHVEQSIAKIFSTFISERVQREWFGSPGNAILGQTATPQNILRWATVIWALIDLFEPRFRVTSFVPKSVSASGTFDLEIIGEYRPYAHLDWQQATMFVSVQDGVALMKSAA